MNLLFKNLSNSCLEKIRLFCVKYKIEVKIDKYNGTVQLGKRTSDINKDSREV